MRDGVPPSAARKSDCLQNIDCVDDEARSFYQKWDFQALAGSPYRLYLSAGNWRPWFRDRDGGGMADGRCRWQMAMADGR